MPYKNKELAKQYYLRNKEKRDEYSRNYRRINAKSLSEKTKKWQQENPEKYKEKNKRWNANNKEKKKSIIMKNEYGITLEEYNLMFEAQGGKCKICGVHQTQIKKPLHIDHCHSKLHVRGLLCQHCNSGLGFFRDNIEVMQLAIKYLEGKL